VPDVVVITAKRLDSIDVDETSVDVQIPESELGQRTQLIDLVRSRFPDAEFRSFANEAASFLAHKLLVVAVYRRSPSDERSDGGMSRSDEQQSLFGA
jgi:hypothetical protein